MLVPLAKCCPHNSSVFPVPEGSFLLLRKQLSFPSTSNNFLQASPCSQLPAGIGGLGLLLVHSQEPWNTGPMETSFHGLWLSSTHIEALDFLLSPTQVWQHWLSPVCVGTLCKFGLLIWWFDSSPRLEFIWLSHHSMAMFENPSIPWKIFYIKWLCG